jgi:hypothetical protein
MVGSAVVNGVTNNKEYGAWVSSGAAVVKYTVWGYVQYIAWRIAGVSLSTEETPVYQGVKDG